MLSDILGWIATILFTVCYVPQMIKTYKTRTTDGLSFLFLGIAFIANIIALVYATTIDQRPLQIKYILALFFDGACILLYLKVRKHEPAARPKNPKRIQRGAW